MPLQTFDPFIYLLKADFEEDVPLQTIVEKQKQRSAIKLKPKVPFTTRYSPEWEGRKGRKGKKAHVVQSDDDANDDDYVEPRPKIPPRRGGKTGKRGRK